MLPKRRSECERVFDTYSTRLNSTFAGHSSGFLPKGAQTKPCTQPPAPFAAMPKYTLSTSTETESAKVVLTSAVGTMRQLCKPSWANTHDTMSAGSQSIAFINTTQTNTVSAAGATNLLRSP